MTTRPAGFRERLMRTFEGWRWLSGFRLLIARMTKHEVSFMAAGLAFYAFLAFVPLILLVVLGYSLLADPATAVSHVRSITRAVSSEVAHNIGEVVLKLVSDTQERKGWGVAVSLLLALYAGVRGARALTQALDRVQETSGSRGFVATTLASIAIVVVALLLAIGALVAVVVLGYLETFVAGISERVALLVKAATWIGMAALAGAAISALYRYAPGGAPTGERRWLTVGGAAATLAWLVSTFLLGVYVANFSRYDAIYGSAATIVIVLMWFYLSALVVIVGAEIDAVRERWP